MRQVPLIVGSVAAGYAGKLSWWRRALRAFGLACVRLATPRARWDGAQLIHWGREPVGNTVDPGTNEIIWYRGEPAIPARENP